MDYMMGMSYTYGLSVEQDDREAAIWYQKAAQQGHEDAQKALDVLAEFPPS
jgi:TPR repeat protein